MNAPYGFSGLDWANALIDVALDLQNQGRHAEAEEKLQEAEAYLAAEAEAYLAAEEASL